MDYALQVAQRLGAPPLFRKEVMDMMADRPPIPAKAQVPEATFTRAINKKPQAIAHRGSKVNCPENTMLAFKEAVEVGVDAIETDVHISKDGVVVISHDPTLKRCYGVDKKIAECDWKELSEMRTVREPHVPMPRLQDVFEYLSQPETAHLWVLLDIKMSVDPNDIMRLIAELLSKIPSAPGTKWQDRVVLGCWAARYVPAAMTHLPGYPITNIGFSIPYSRQFLSVPNISFNLLLAALWSPAGRRFIAQAQRQKAPIYVWTVNDEKGMDWCIRKKLDGVITDDPKKYIQFRDAWDERKPALKWSWKVVMMYVKMNVFAMMFGLIFWRRYGFGLKFEGGAKKA